MKYYFLCCLMWVAISGLSAQYHENMAEAISASETSGKDLLIVYTMDVCPPCQNLKHTLELPNVKKQLQNYEVVELPVSKSNAIYPYVPCIIILDKNRQLKLDYNCLRPQKLDSQSLLQKLTNND